MIQSSLSHPVGGWFYMNLVIDTYQEKSKVFTDACQKGDACARTNTMQEN